MPEAIFTAKNTILDLDSKVSPAILAGIFGVNVSLLYQEVQIGRLPILIESTYRECIQHYIAHFKKSVDVKILKEKNEYDLRLKRAGMGTIGPNDSFDDSLVANKMKQEIRLNKAREAQIWLRIAIERQDYLSVKEFIPLIEPFVLSIKNILLSMADDVPSLQNKVDEGMASLYNFGKRILDITKSDSENFISAMMEKNIELVVAEESFSNILGEA